MKVLEIRDLAKKDTPLHYRNEYTGMALLETPSKQPLQSRIRFTLERKATGGVDISVKLVDDINYPIMPVIRNLKEFIGDLDRKGKLS